MSFKQIWGGEYAAALGLLEGQQERHKQLADRAERQQQLNLQAAQLADSNAYRRHQLGQRSQELLFQARQNVLDRVQQGQIQSALQEQQFKQQAERDRQQARTKDLAEGYKTGRYQPNPQLQALSGARATVAMDENLTDDERHSKLSEINQKWEQAYRSPVIAPPKAAPPPPPVLWEKETVVVDERGRPLTKDEAANYSGRVTILGLDRSGKFRPLIKPESTKDQKGEGSYAEFFAKNARNFKDDMNNVDEAQVWAAYQAIKERTKFAAMSDEQQRAVIQQQQSEATSAAQQRWQQFQATNPQGAAVLAKRMAAMGQAPWALFLNAQSPLSQQVPPQAVVPQPASMQPQPKPLRAPQGISPKHSAVLEKNLPQPRTPEEAIATLEPGTRFRKPNGKIGIVPAR